MSDFLGTVGIILLFGFLLFIFSPETIAHAISVVGAAFEVQP